MRKTVIAKSNNLVDTKKQLQEALECYKNDLRCAYHNGESAQYVRRIETKVKELEKLLKEEHNIDPTSLYSNGK
jgi:hypothetical protein